MSLKCNEFNVLPVNDLGIPVHLEEKEDPKVNSNSVKSMTSILRTK
jgi:hypothetical protein